MAGADTIRPTGDGDGEARAEADEEVMDLTSEASVAPQLELGDDDVRLPWLESDDDEDDYRGGGSGQLAILLLVGLAAIAAIAGGIWWFTRPPANPVLVADGSVIEAPAQPYKEKPRDPGGKTFEGTGDTSFAVAKGQTRPVRLGEDTTAKAASPTPTPSSRSSAPAQPSAQGPGVQVAAYSNRAQAEAGWTRLSQQYEALSGVSHRVVEGQADIGTVYRLQAVPGDAAAARTLCGKLKAAGLPCQVKN